jgi:hypothetical protein
MKISKEKWQKWASEYADKTTAGMAKDLPLTLHQAAAVKCMLEAAMMCGFSMVEEFRRQGCDTTECYDLKPTLVRNTTPPTVAA